MRTIETLKVRSMLAGVNEEKAAELETRALEVWDRLYQAWMMNAIEEKTTMGPKVTSSAVYQTWENFVDAMHKTPGKHPCLAQVVKKDSYEYKNSNIKHIYYTNTHKVPIKKKIFPTVVIYNFFLCKTL